MQQASQELVRPGAQFGRYRIVRLIGAGAMGTVYEATHVDLKKQVAFKALNPLVALDEAARERFLHEGEVASRIRHPNVVEVFDVGIEHDVPYLVMEFLEGEAFSDLLARESPLPTEQLAGIMLPVIAAVATAHEEGVLHRDLKPDNIFLARSRHGEITPKLLDFGISKLTNVEEARNLTGGGTLLGTPMYMSPEAATRAKNIDGRSDQYALGVMLYEAATGHDPFDGETLYTLFHAIVSGNFAPPRSYRADLPPAFEALICRAMATEPEFRFPSCAALGRALLPFAPARDCVIWGPAFEPKRVAGAPLNPSLFPAGGDDLRSLKSNFLDSDVWTANDKDNPSPFEPDEAGIFRKPGREVTLDEDDPGYVSASGVRTTSKANGHAGNKSYPADYAWDGSEQTQRTHLASTDAEATEPPRPSRPSRPSSDHVGLSAEENAALGRSAGSSSRLPWALGGALLALVGVGVGFVLSRAQTSESEARGAQPHNVAAAAPETFRVVVVASPSSAELLLDGVALGLGRIDERLPRDGTDHVLTVRADGHEPQQLRFRDAAPRGLVTLSEVMPAGLSPEAAATPSASPADATAPLPTAEIDRGTPEEGAALPAPQALAADVGPTGTARGRLGRNTKNRVESPSPAPTPPAVPPRAAVITPRVAATANDAPILD